MEYDKIVGDKDKDEGVKKGMALLLIGKSGQVQSKNFRP